MILCHFNLTTIKDLSNRLKTANQQLQMNAKIYLSSTTFVQEDYMLMDNENKIDNSFICIWICV